MSKTGYTDPGKYSFTSTPPVIDRERILRALPIGEYVEFDYSFNSTEITKLSGAKWEDNPHYMGIKCDGFLFHVFYEAINHISIAVAERLIGNKPDVVVALQSGEDYVRFIRRSSNNIIQVDYCTRQERGVNAIAEFKIVLHHSCDIHRYMKTEFQKLKADVERNKMVSVIVEFEVVQHDNQGRSISYKRESSYTNFPTHGR